MKRADGGQSAGYTIVEAMIFLAVTGAMFISMMAFISGRRERTEFVLSARDFETSLNDIANDVQNGYYANVTSTGREIACTPTSGAINNINSGVNVTAATMSGGQGANRGCLFIGKSIQFSPRGGGMTGSQYLVHTLIGRQYKDNNINNGDADNFYATGSGVQVVYPTANHPSVPDGSQQLTLGPSAKFGCVMYSNSAGFTPTITGIGTDWCDANATGSISTDTVVFMSTFRGVTLAGDDPAGSRQVDFVVPTRSLPLNRTIPAGANVVNTFYDHTRSLLNPNGGLMICLESEGTDQYAIITIGGNASRYTAKTEIYAGGCT